MEGWENECKLAHGVLQCMTVIVLLGSLELLQHWWKILIGIMFPWISFNLTRCIDLQGLLSMKWVLKLLRLCLLHFCDLNTKYRGGHEMECTLGDAVKVMLEHWISHTFCHFCSLLLEKWTKWKLYIQKSVCAILWVKTKGGKRSVIWAGN